MQSNELARPGRKGGNKARQEGELRKAGRKMMDGGGTEETAAVLERRTMNSAPTERLRLKRVQTQKRGKGDVRSVGAGDKETRGKETAAQRAMEA